MIWVFGIKESTHLLIKVIARIMSKKDDDIDWMIRCLKAFDEAHPYVPLMPYPCLSSVLENKAPISQGSEPLDTPGEVKTS